MNNSILKKFTLLLPGLLLFLSFSLFAQNKKADDLHKALNEGNIEQVKQIIEKDISLLETPNPRGSTPLIVAAADGHPELVEFLINKGADINATNDYGNSVLHYAAWTADFDMFKNIHNNGASLNVKNSRGQNLLQYSCMGGNMDIFKYCISNGMDINAKYEDGSSLIHWAAYGGNLDLFKMLEKKGFAFDLKDKDGSTPIFWACSGNKLGVVKYLIEEKGVDVNTVDDLGICPLKSSIERGGLEVTKYLLEKGANIDFKMENNVTWMELAAQSNNPELIQLLIDKGCKLNVFDDFGNTPLTTAAGHGNFEVVKILVENGANLNPGICKRESCNSNGQTPLHHASWRHSKIVEYLIEKGADVNQKDTDGNAALHKATWSDDSKITEILLQNNAKIDIQNKLGKTPVMYAIERNKPEILKTLIKNKTDLSLADNSGMTPLHYASITGYKELSDMLIKAGANINVKDNKGNTPAYYAIYHGNETIAFDLFKTGADKKNMPDEEANLLNKDLNDKEACIWYLNHSGWAIKTKNHFLVFDYWQRGVDPNQASINNGRINPKELKDQNVMVFVSHNHNDHFDRHVTEWKKDLTNIKYIMGFETNLLDDYVYIPPREEQSVDKVKITPISSTDSGEGFMVEVDGLTIYHPGDHANRFEDEDKEFSEEIDFLAEKYNNIDIAFVPITGCSFRNKKALVQGNNYMVKKFNPELVLPMHGSGNEYKYKEYADERNKELEKSVYKSVSNKGDRFIYKNEKKAFGYNTIFEGYDTLFKNIKSIVTYIVHV